MFSCDSFLPNNSRNCFCANWNDGPNVNWYFMTNFVLREVSWHFRELFHTGNSGLHILHGSFITEENATDWKLGKYLKALFDLFSDYPIGRDAAFGIWSGNHNCRQNCLHSKQKRDQEEQKQSKNEIRLDKGRSSRSLNKKKAREKVEFNIKKVKSIDEDLQNVCSQQES